MGPREGDWPRASTAPKRRALAWNPDHLVLEATLLHLHILHSLTICTEECLQSSPLVYTGYSG